MKRRDFLQTAGLLTAGATDVLATCRASEAVDSQLRGRRTLRYRTRCTYNLLQAAECGVNS